MFFRLLGPLEVTDGNRSIPLGEGRQRNVLVLLLLRRNEAVASDRLLDALWGEAPPPTAAKVLQNHVRQLRRALGDREGQRLQTRGHAYALRVEDGELDLDRFEELLLEGGEALERGRPADAAARLREALALWRGPPLADVAYEPFAQGEIARLEERHTVALEQRIDADLALGRHAQLVGDLEALVAEQPLRERLRAQLMIALYRCGRQADALDVYQRARRALLDELGVEPGPALRELQAAILRQDPELAPAPGAWPRPLRSSRRRVALLAVGGILLLAAAIAATLVELGSGERPIRVESNSVAVIDPRRDAVVGQVSVGARPRDISAGAGGVWVANLDDDSVSQIDPEAAKVVHTFSTGRSVDALATGAGGVWTVDLPHATATQVDPAFRNIVRRIRVGPDRPASTLPSPIATGGDSVWVATGNAAVARIAARSRKKVLARVDVGNEPAGIAFGAGATWVADDLDDTVSRIDPAGVVTATLPVGRGASGVAVGAGSVWVADTLDDVVTRIDAATNAPKTTIPVGAAPMGIAVGAGAVWVANSLAGTVSRIDPRTDRVTNTIAIGGSPEGVAVAAGRVWVTVQAGSVPPGAPGAGGALRVAQEKDFNSTDPALLAGYGPQAGQLAFAACAKLLNYPDRPAPPGTRLIPEVAAAMPSVSPDGRTYTFTTRRGFRFAPPSNQPVTARAFQRALERFLSPRMQPAGGPAAFLSDIAGFRAYRSGRTRHLSGVTATDTTLTIRLTRAAPSLPARITMPFLCAVPPNTPIRAGGVEGIPSAGPYYIATHIPNRELVLRRNPNYHGPRPHRLDEIDYRFGVPATRAVALVESGQADYANAAIGDQHFARNVPPAVQADLDRRYGPRAAAARAGGQRYFINRTLALQSLLLNSRRPLFARARMRRAVNFAVDRAALAQHAGPGFSGTPTDQYLPTGMPGFKDAEIYPLGAPNVARARRLAGGRHGRAVMYTCNASACLQLAEVVKANLRAIGIDVQIKRFPLPEMFRREFTRGGPWDIAFFGWAVDYPDPSDFIDLPFTGSDVDFPGADAQHYRRRIAAAARLAGERRLRAYGHLDIDLATHAAPVIAFANVTSHDFFSARIGCQIFQPIYGMDLAALCRRAA